MKMKTYDKRMEKGYDPKCRELAAHFINDDGTVEPEDKRNRIHALAQVIQNAIDAELADPR